MKLLISLGKALTEKAKSGIVYLVPNMVGTSWPLAFILLAPAGQRNHPQAI
jgi:hypothetical protein